MQPTFRLGRIHGIEVGVHWTVMGIVAIVAWSLGASVLPDSAPGYPAWSYAVAGCLAGVAFGCAILVHELSHSIVATQEGVAVDGIVLWMFGGVAKLHTRARSARSELRIALAGPLASFALGVLALGAASAGDATRVVPLLVAAVAWFGAANLLVGVFNLLPGAPLDGGRVLAALLWRRSGDAYLSRKRASSAGRALGMALIGAGVLQFAYVGAGGLWTMLVGWLIVSMARAELVEIEHERLLADVVVRDVMTTEVVTVAETMTIEQLMAGPWIDARASTFPLVDTRGCPTGLLRVPSILRVDRSLWRSTALRDVAIPLDRVAQARPDDLLLDALQRRDDERARILVTLDGTVRGIVSPSDVVRALERLSVVGRRLSDRGSLARPSDRVVIDPPGRQKVTLPLPPPPPPPPLKTH